jgi:hypothetical protein
MDHGAGILPDQLTADLVAASDSCLAIGTLAAADGETRITLADDLDGIEVGDLVFDGVLSTPNHELSVCNVNNEKLLTVPVSRTSTSVKVFANDLREPDQIVIYAKVT